MPTAESSPHELAPTDQANYCWPRWGQHYQTKGDAGEPVDMAAPRELLDLYMRWSRAATAEERAEIWRRMLDIHAEEVFIIGTVSRAPVPVVAKSTLRNVPAEGLYTWDPGGQLGIHRIDEFWLDEGPRAEAAEAGAG